jgi:putative ABC transport system substrate-binding protein
MTRRKFVGFIISVVVCWPFAAHAQQPVPVIGWLGGQRPDLAARHMVAFAQGLAESGFIDGHNVAFDSRWADNQYGRLPALAAELVQRRVALIAAISHGSTPAALAAKAVTTTIPIVFSVGSDPVQTGIVANLNRPGGNVTGSTFFANQLGSKRLGLLHELLPQAKVIAVLTNPNFPDAADKLRDVQEAARALGLQVYVVNAGSEAEIDAGFASLVRERADALFVDADPFLSSRHEKVVALAARHALPAIYDLRDTVLVGGLIGYGTSQGDAHHQAGAYAGRILKGERPADLPVLQPTKFQTVINLRTAKELGLTVPPKLLFTADEVIE